MLADRVKKILAECSLAEVSKDALIHSKGHSFRESTSVCLSMYWGPGPCFLIQISLSLAPGYI
jgi:hypothetical protein